MKKCIALLLALLLALSAVPVLAGEATQSGQVVSLKISVDRDRAGKILENTGMDENGRGLADTVLAVLNAAENRLTLGENSLRYDLLLSEKEMLSITGGRTAEGLVILGSLFPDYAVTVSSDTLDVAELIFGFAADAVQRRSAESVPEEASAFLRDLISAVRPEEAERGTYAFENGITYNTRMRVGLDSRVIIKALNSLIGKFTRSRLLPTVLEKLSGPADKLLSLSVVAKRLPAFDLVLYANLDDSGAALTPEQGLTFSFTLPGKKVPSVSAECHVRENGLEAALNIPVDGETGSGNLLAFSFTVLERGRVPLADLSVGERKNIAMESLVFNRERAELLKKLVSDIMYNSIRVMADAAESVPEIVDLLFRMKSR